MFCPPTLTKIPAGQPGRFKYGMLGLLRVSCWNVAARREPAHAWTLVLLPFLAPSQQGSLHIHMHSPALTAKFFPCCPNTHSEGTYQHQSHP